MACGRGISADTPLLLQALARAGAGLAEDRVTEIKHCLKQTIAFSEGKGQNDGEEGVPRGQ